MTLLPIVSRELRVAARRRLTFANRTAAAALAVFVWGWWYLVNMSWAGASQIGRSLFQALVIFGFLYCLIMGICHTADSLSRERRDGTLGLLFLTHLKGYDVVLGKLVSTSLSVIMGLVSMMPILMFTVLLGGVSFEMFWIGCLILLNTLFYSLTLGLWVSSFCTSARLAFVGAFILMVFFTLVLPIMVISILNLSERSLLFAVIACPSPGYAIGLFIDGISTGFNWARLGGTLATVQAFAWFFFLHACHRAERGWKDQAETTHTRRWQERWQRWNLGSDEASKRPRERILDASPIRWLEERHRAQKKLVWGALFLFALFYEYNLLTDVNWVSMDTFIFSGFFLHSMVVIWIAFHASHRLAEDKASGALELIFATPLTDRDLLQGRLVTLKKQFLGPVAAVLIFEAIELALFFGKHYSTSQSYSIPRWDWNGLIFFLTSISIFLINVITASWVGTWQGLVATNSLRAAMATVSRTLILHWLLFLGFLAIIVALERWLTSIGFTFRDRDLPKVWLLFGVTTNLYFLFRARKILKSGFRAVASKTLA